MATAKGLPSGAPSASKTVGWAWQGHQPVSWTPTCVDSNISLFDSVFSPSERTNISRLRSLERALSFAESVCQGWNYLTTPTNLNDGASICTAWPK